MDGNKINIINFKTSLCCFLSKDVDTRGRSQTSIVSKVAVALICFNGRHFVRKDLL